MQDFSGRVYVVTGAGGGIGYETTEQLVANGADVLMLDIKEPESLPDAPGKARFIRTDLTDFHAVKAAMETCPRIDGLVNAAGVLLIGKDVGAVEIDLDIWDRVMSINLKSMVHTIKVAVPKMADGGGGAIVNISTIQCLRGDNRPQDAYQASKAGVIALTKSIAIQHAAQGVRANTVLPGPTETPMQDRWKANPSQKEATAAAIPLGRVGRPEDIANACLFLLSDRASYITGTELIVDGGVTALP